MLGPLSIGALAASGAGAPGLTYIEKVLATQSASLIAYWPLNEASGTVAVNAEGTAALNGSYARDLATMGTQTGIGDGNTAPTFDGTSDFVNIYSAALAAAFNGDQYTIALWFKVAAAGVWSDGVQRFTTILRGSTSANQIQMFKDTTAGRFGFLRTAAAASKLWYQTGLSSTDWLHLAMVCDVAGDALKAYINGVQAGATQSTLSAWTSGGALTSSQTLLGALTQTPSAPLVGSLAHAAIWHTPLTEPEITALANPT